MIINDDKTIYIDQTKFTTKKHQKKDTGTIYIDQTKLDTQTIKYNPKYSINKAYIGPENLTDKLSDDIYSTKNTVSRLVSSVKEIQREEKITKRKRWIRAMKSRRRYF